jgi:hypothetical protein
MKPIKAAIMGASITLLGSGHCAFAASGYATRDQNPILQQFYLPTLAPFSDSNGWRIDHSLYVTNTLQNKSNSDEKLIIDVENYRYDLGLKYRMDNWLTQVNIPFIDNNGGQLDGLIDSWHDFFGLPDGDRNDFPKDEVNIEYQRDGVVEYSQNSSSSGLGDTSLALGHQRPGEPGLFVGIELPTGSESDYTGNETIDFGFWATHAKKINAKTNLYGLLGLSFPGDDGNLEGLIVDQILVGQLGADYLFDNGIVGTAQFDYHSAIIDDSDLTAFGDSLQIQLGLGFLELIDDYRLDLFFSEDIYVGSAPDITFGIRLMQNH